MFATLTTSTDLETWAQSHQARARLPELVRRLVCATNLSKLEEIRFRSDEGVQLAGWDGFTRSAGGNAWVPDGIAGWEMGTGDPAAKATADYLSRTADPTGRDPAATTFVFVTPRRWGGKDKWIKDRSGERRWKAVTALDADDLQTWLENAPGVHLWLSSLLGRRPRGACDLETFWKQWASDTMPPISAEFLTAGRDAEVKRLIQWLGAPPGTLTLRAATSSEAISFMGAVVDRLELQDQGRALSRAVVVEDAEAWNTLTRSHAPLILVPVVPVGGVALASAAGHHVMIPIGPNAPEAAGEVTLPPLAVSGIRSCLEKLGVRNAEELAELARRSLPAYRRRTSQNPTTMIPAWAQPDAGRKLVAALLAGRWKDTSAGDQQVLARLAGRSYDDLRNDLIRWANEPDSPLRLIGDSWFVVALEDAWSQLSRLVVDADMARFRDVVEDVLGERDPQLDLAPGDRWLALLEGKVRSRSEDLRRGVVDVLAVLGTGLRLATSRSDEWSERIVRKICTAISSQERWVAIEPYLPILAEASPDPVLAAIDSGISGNDPVLRAVLAAQQHTGVLWALETLAWSPQYLPEAAVALVRLAALDPGGQLANRPARTLRQIFLPWHASTAAPAAERLNVLDGMLSRYPDATRDLLLDLLPKYGPDTASWTRTPKFRQWASDRTPATSRAAVDSLYVEMARRLITDAAMDPRRWAAVIPHLSHLPRAFFDEAVAKLQEIPLEQLADEGKTPLWKALRRLVARHRCYATAGWALGAPDLATLERVRDRCLPSDAVTRASYVFGKEILFEFDRNDHNARCEALQRARSEATADVLANGGGMAGIHRLVEATGDSFEVGSSLGQGEPGIPDEVAFLSSSLGADDAMARELARGYLSGRRRKRGDRWLKDLQQRVDWDGWDAAHRSDYFAAFLFEGTTWDNVSADGADTEARYWRDVAAQRHQRGTNRGDMERAARMLVKHGGARLAVEFLAILAGDEAVDAGVVATLLEEAAFDPNDETDWSVAGYELTELLTFLEKRVDSIDITRIARLEFFFLPLLDQGPRLVLENVLAQDPAFFIEVLKWLYGAEGDEPSAASEETRGRSQRGFELLHRWSKAPGVSIDGTVDAAQLLAWIDRARTLAAQAGRAVIGDIEIGKMLSRLPSGLDGIWPHEGVRTAIETVRSVHLDEGFTVGTFNGRGVVVRSLDEGGVQERSLADTFRMHAEKLSVKWPRVARIARQIAQEYEFDGRREDSSVRLRDHR